MSVLVLVAGAAVLLTACNQPSPAAGGEEGGPVPVSTTATPPGAGAGAGTESAGEPVECGPVEVDALGTHTLIAQPSSGGVVGCTQAFNVIGEYLQIPSAERSASFEGTPLSGGWTCSTDDGEVLSIGCVKGKNGDEWDFAFSTTPVDK
jgi:hypothetical protein